MKTNILKMVAVVGLATGLLVSCSKPVNQQVYPNEITLDNWEEFVNAPEEVINDLIEKEQKAVATRALRDDIEAPKCAAGPNFGWVRT